MSTKNETVRGLIGIAVDLGVMCIYWGLYNGVPNVLVFHDMISKAIEDDLVLSLALATGLHMVRRSGDEPNTKEAHNITDNLLHDSAPLLVSQS